MKRKMCNERAKMRYRHALVQSIFSDWAGDLIIVLLIFKMNFLRGRESMGNISILAIVGSLRKESYNLQLAKEAEKYLKNKVNIEIIDFSEVPLLS
ncbi:NAD(P)H-dependent oxidoreductase [Acetobacterium fimetarium]|nr:NAD(P)H-dependent oxidoreductase [Acetobacterium fimetarium]